MEDLHTPTESPQLTNVNPWTIGFALAMVLLVSFIIIAAGLLFKVVKLRRVHKHLNEIQPNLNHSYMTNLGLRTEYQGEGCNEPTNGESSEVQHTYYTTDSLEYAYAQP